MKKNFIIISIIANILWGITVFLGLTAIFYKDPLILIAATITLCTSSLIFTLFFLFCKDVKDNK